MIWRTLLSLGLLVSIPSWAASGKPTLRWGGDAESGAPFAYKDPSNPEKIIGFEADIVEALAAELGMEVQFVQNNWEGLIEGLKRKDYDIVVNGLEITPDREQVVRFSRPYYITSETLTVRSSNVVITKLEHVQGRRVGTLPGSLAQRILSEQSFPLEIVPYSEEVHAYEDLANGRVDATLLDEPIALYYAGPNENLKNLPERVGELAYGVVTRKSDRNLSVRVDRALAHLIESGKLRTILERWNLWNPQVAKAWGQDPTPQSPAVMYNAFLKNFYKKMTLSERIERYISFLPVLAKGAVMTLELSIVAMAFAMMVGLVAALCRLYGPAPLSFLSLAFVELFRGTPLLIQLFLIFYGLPHLGLRLDPFTAAILGLGLNYGACEAENYRAGILSIPKAQMDASRALGMSWGQSLRHIILPQAVRVVIPPVTNDFIALLKDSSLVSIITMTELTSTYGQLASTYFDYLGIGLLTAAVYFLIGLPFVRLSRYFENQLNNHRKVRGPAREPARTPSWAPAAFLPASFKRFIF